jgi:hypothetical protein
MKWLRMRRRTARAKRRIRARTVARLLGVVRVCAMCVAFSPGTAPGAEISLMAPSEEGGTPRSVERLAQIGPREFRVRASVEEGFSPLAHAVSRVDLLCHNDTPQSLIVTLHIDLSNDGQRTDYDNKPEAGMKLRDFVFIQPPGKSWQQVNGTTEGWVATVQFSAEPGDTKIGLSPWYQYSDLLHWVHGLGAHPHLEKKIIGTSDGGREQWELTITDPAVAREKKQVIFWHAREHAYETFSSFAIEGLIPFLLSDEAARFRQRFVFVLHPMTNVDGVAQGYEYRAGYDHPKPRASATGRMTFATIDRLHPDVAVAWHNWIAPRDRNVVFYTDSEHGEPSARAWLRFTQLFPSLHGGEHRWREETNPLKYNWSGRTPLSEANLHQYAMKKFNTRIWGWEMPWWNFTPDDARKFGAAFARALLTTLEEIDAGTVPAAVARATIDVPRWQMHEFTSSGGTHLANPFRDAALVGEFISPSHKTIVVDGFYDGDRTWRLRFAPDEEGEWSYLLRGEGVEILERGAFRCTAARSHGFIRRHPENPSAFAYADGTPFFPMGDTCYGLHDDSPITPELRAEYLRTRRGQRFNYVRMHVGGSMAHAERDNAYWAWGGTAGEPDLDTLNPIFFHRLDALFRELRDAGMNVELILLNFYRRPFLDMRTWTRVRERLWLRYLLARYSAFDNVFLWTIANEYETHPDGKYRLDLPDDVAWAKSTARFIHEQDPHRHLVTVHPVISATTHGRSPRDPIEQPWRIGEFFGTEDSIDVLSQQTGQLGPGLTWDAKLGCWNGDEPGIVASIRDDRRFRKPVINSENGYEYLRGDPTSKKQVHHTDKVRRSAWRIVCAGGYFAAGFHGTLGHSDVWNRLDAPNRYTFQVKDEGAAGQLRSLYDFFASLSFSRMEPFTDVTGEAVALAEAGKTYVIYLPHGGETRINLPPGAQLTRRWFNPRSAQWSPEETMIGRAAHQDFTAPDTNDWVLLLQER